MKRTRSAVLRLASSKERGYHIVVGIFISLVGLIITVTTLSHGAQYAGLCILLFGSYISAPLTLAWLSGNNPGRWTVVYTFRDMHLGC